MTRGRRRRPPADRRGGRRGPARGRQRGRRRGLRGARLLRGREPADRVRRRRLHDGPPAAGETTPDRLLRRRARARRDRARGGAGPGPGPLRRRDRADVLRRAGLLRRARHRRRPRARRCERFGSVPLADLVGPGDPPRPRGRAGQRRAGLHPRHPRADPRAAGGHARALRARRAAAARGRRLPLPRAGRGAGTVRRRRAPSPSTAARSRRRSASSSSRSGGTLGPADLAAYEAIERQPIRAAVPRHRGADQPAALLGRDPDRLLASACSSGSASAAAPSSWSRRWAPPTTRRGDEFAEALYGEGLEAELARPGRRSTCAAGDLLGSTTHISVLDGDGMCASVTCSNGSGSGVLVPGTGVILNNMLGEEDLNPLGFHAIAPGRRVPSMMAPDRGPARRRDRAGPRQRRLEPDPLGDPADGGARGRAGDARRRRRCGRRGCTSSRASSRPSPGSTRRRWRGSRRAACRSLRRPRINLFFGGVQAVARDPRRARSAAAATRAAAAPSR